MKKTLFHGILASLLLGSAALTVQAQTLDVDRTKYPDYTEKMNPDWSLVAPKREAKATGMKRNVASQRPDHVNNAETKHFPPVFNQDGGSCGSASRICYMFSYELAAYRDLDGSKPENYYPSHFVWLHTYSPTDRIDQGKNGFVMHMGVPSAATYGGQTYSSLYGYQEANSEDFGWMQGYDKWFEAMHNRMLQPVNFPQSIETEEGREAVKNWLWNHNGDDDFAAGGICGIGVASGGVWKKIPKTDTNDKIGVTDMYYVYEWGTQVDHALTIVGYDDRIEFDLDKDGIVGEADADEVGAWIIVNSWGDWCNGGFIYCPYAFAGSAFNNDGKAGERTFNGDFWWPEIYKVRKDYRPLRTIKLEMDYSRRSEIALSAGISADLDATEPEKTIPFVHFTYAGDGNYGNGTSEESYEAPEVPMLGRWADGKLHTEPMEFGYDLTDLTEGYDMNQPLKYFFIIDSHAQAEGEGTIYKASIMDYLYDELGIETPFGVGEGIEVKNQGKKTIISVVVQGSSYYAPQNASYVDGVLTWQSPMRSATTVEEYRVYADGALVATLPANTTSYAPESAVSVGEYAVTAVYEGGKESSEATALTPIEASSPNMGMQFAQSGFTIPSVFSTTYQQATIEYWIKPTTVTNYNQSGGPGWGRFMFHANANGQFTVGWDTNNRLSTNSITTLQPNKWIHIAMVINGNKITTYLNGINRGSVTSQTYSGVGGFGDLVFAASNSSPHYEDAQNAVYDEIRIWNTARTKEQIKAAMNAEFTGSLMPQGLIAYLKGDVFTDGEGNTLMRDCVGGHHATLHGTGCTPVSSGLPTLGVSTGAPTVSIDEPKATIYAGLPTTLSATYNENANRLVWTASGAGVENLSIANPTLTFATVGTHTVSVTAIGADGSTTTATRNIVVEASPVLDATFSMTATEVPAGERVTLHASTPRMGYIYQWSMPGADMQTAASPSVGTSWQKQGTYKITLTVTAPDGSKQSHTESIQVIEVAPEAAFSISPAVVVKGETFTLNDESLYAPTNRQWYLTNGTDNYIVYADTNNVVIDNPGVYNVKLTVSNNSGQSSYLRERALIVTNADSKNGLVFGYDAATVTATKAPLSAGQKSFTIEWWMNAEWPVDDSNGIGESDETMLLKTMGGGKMQLCISGKSALTSDNYVVPGEWHHYAVAFASGKAKFYRDGVLIITRPISSVSELPEMSTFRIGGAQTPFKGSIDELRIWGSELSVEELYNYANAPITDVAKAESDKKLVLYYNCNQNGGDLQDATSNANHGVRTGFGPDGDAWGLSRGVFCLATNKVAGGKDLTGQYLKNYTQPFACTRTCINPNIKDRAFELTGWTLENTVTAYAITAGAHVDKGKNSSFTVTTGWDAFSSTLTDHKAFQTITLPAGCYTFSATYDATYEGQCGSSYIVVAEGNTLPVTEDLSQAIAYTAMQGKGLVSSNAVTFILSKESTISLGLLVNMGGSQCMALQKFSLAQTPITVIGNTDKIPSTGIEEIPMGETSSSSKVVKGIYDLTGRKLREDSSSTDGLAPGLYIINGRKTVVK